jgi:hypothetical protein
VPVLDDVRQQVVRRLEELEPLMAEYRELEQIAERLGVSRTSDEVASRRSSRSRTRVPARAKASPAADGQAPTTSRRRSTGRRRTGSRRNTAAPGSRQQDVLRLVNERPGISVPELGKELGVDPTGLYQIVRRLEGRGAVRKDGRRLQPVAASVQNS